MEGKSKAWMTERKGARYCPRCSQSIKGASVVVFDAGQFFHHRCFVEDAGRNDAIHAFLRRHFPSSFCAHCLTRTFALTHEQARTLVRASRTIRRLVILPAARCAGCRQSRLTVRAVAYDETPPTFDSP